MHLTIISCTPRAQAKSNTAKIIEAFRRGFEAEGGTSETHFLSQRGSWPRIRQAFAENDCILFAIPLFVECVPGIMLEFLETLEPKAEAGTRTRVAFLLQGGFAEASQLRCCEQYLETLPARLGCDFAGTLIKGNMFAVSIVDEKARAGMIRPFEDMGRRFARQGCFEKQAVTEFAAPEYFSKGASAVFTLMNPLQKMFLYLMSRKLGAKGSLKARPYQKYLK